MKFLGNPQVPSKGLLKGGDIDMAHTGPYEGQILWAILEVFWTVGRKGPLLGTPGYLSSNCT